MPRVDPVAAAEYQRDWWRARSERLKAEGKMRPEQGRPRMFTDEQVEDMLAMRAGGASYRALAEAFGCSKDTARVYCDPAAREYRQNWNDTHRENIQAWKDRNPAYAIHKGFTDRLRWTGRGDEPTISREDFEAIYYAHTECMDCTVTLTNRKGHGRIPATQRECHHIVPISQGGMHVAENIAILCAACHKRWDRDVEANAGRTSETPASV